MATANGSVSFIEHDKIWGNMRAGILIVEANSIANSTETVYDLVQIEREKKERDEKKRQDELEQAKTELERLKAKQSDSDDSTKLLNQIINDSQITDNNQLTDSKLINQTIETLTEQDQSKDNDEESKESEQDQSKDNDEESKEPEQMNRTTKKIKQSTKEKRDKYVEKLRKDVKEHAERTERNKYFRNFMKEFKSKFSIEPMSQFKFFEIRAQSTDMVIDNAVVYTINMPIVKQQNKTYLLIVGDIQMKSGLIRQIDPNYKPEKFFKDNLDFLDRIKAKEKSITTELPANVINNEIDGDLLDILDADSDEEIISESN